MPIAFRLYSILPPGARVASNGIIDVPELVPRALTFTPSTRRENRMKAFVAAAGIVFALLVIVHVWRVALEGQGVANPFFIGVTVIAAGFSVWAWRVYRKL